MTASTLPRQSAALAGRALRRTARQPAAWLPGLLVPLTIAAVFTADYGRAATLIGFPASASYLRYVLPATVLTGAVYAGIVAGTEATTDVENGFIDRLATAPARRAAILAGPLTVTAIQAVLQSCVFIAIFAAFGADLHGSPAGLLELLAGAALFAMAVGAAAIALGLMTGDSEVMQSLFGVLFIGLFVSSAFFPPGDMHGWFRAAAAHDPITWLADGMRGQVLGGPGATGAGTSLATAGVLCAAAILLAARALRARVRAA
jgi:ABC-type multidrug transport system permease subunit